MKARSKVWLEENGEQVFGSGKARILQAVAETGSLNAAAKKLKMSYRHVWSSIRAAEERLGEPLLIKSRGGKKGGGAALTPFAAVLIEQFDCMSREIHACVDQSFEKHFKKSGRKKS